MGDRNRRQPFHFFLFSWRKCQFFLDDGIYTRLRFHAHRATERGDEFRREKKRNGVREGTRQRKSKAVSQREGGRERIIEFPVTRRCQPSLIGYQPQGH